MVTCRRPVSDEEYNQALANKDNLHVIKSVLVKYRKALSREDLQSCGLKALWRALQYYRPEFGQKFTTSLHLFVRWECNHELKKRPKGGYEVVAFFEENMDFVRRSGNKGPEEELETLEDLNHIRERMRLLPHDWQRQVIAQHYFDQMSMTQIGEANGYGRETARKRVREAVKVLRRICSEGIT